MKPSEGYEHSFGRPTAAVNTDTCVLQKKSIDGGTQGPRAGRPIAAVGIHMCVSEYTHVWCRTSQGKLCQFQRFGRPIAAVSTYTPVLQKRSTEGWPTTCCCEQRTCVAQQPNEEVK